MLTFKGKIIWCILDNVFCNYSIDCLASYWFLIVEASI